MKRLKCVIAYDGTNFQGYQIQNNGRTVQAEIENVLKKMHKGNPVSVTASGRTDTGVHALGQVIHFDSPIDIEENKWMKALNSQLPNDIAILSAEYVPKAFHARYSSIGKEYRYRVLIRKTRDPFLRNYTYHFPYEIDVSMMREAMGYFIGTHDFTSFCSTGTTVKDKVRTIEKFELVETESELQFQIRGTGFLYNMVRIIIGTVLEVGQNKRHPRDIRNIIEERDRTKAGKTVPGSGLYLYKVYYP